MSVRQQSRPEWKLPTRYGAALISQRPARMPAGASTRIVFRDRPQAERGTDFSVVFLNPGAAGRSIRRCIAFDEP